MSTGTKNRKTGRGTNQPVEPHPKQQFKHETIDLNSPPQQEPTTNLRSAPDTSLFYRGKVHKSQVSDRFNPDDDNNNYDEHDDEKETSRERRLNNNNDVGSNNNDISAASVNEDGTVRLREKSRVENVYLPYSSLNKRKPLNESRRFAEHQQHLLEENDDININDIDYEESLDTDNIQPSVHQQICNLQNTPHTILGPQIHSFIVENPGTIALVSPQPPKINNLRNNISESNSPTGPKIHMSLPRANYAISPGKKTVYQLPKFNDMTSILLFSLLTMFTIVCMINIGSYCYHQYKIYNTVPYVSYNQYILNNYNIKDHGLGTINNLLRTGPTLSFSISYVFKSFIKNLFSPPNLTTFVHEQSYNHVQRTIAKNHHYDPKSLNALNTNHYYNNNFSSVQKQLLDIDNNTHDIKSPFYSKLTTDHGLCYANDLNHNNMPKITSSTTSSSYSSSSTTSPQQPTPIHQRTSLYDRTLGFVSKWFNNSTVKRQLDWEENNLEFVYSTLFQFIFSSFFMTAIVIGAGLWKDLTAIALIRTLNNINFFKSFPHLRNRQYQPNTIGNRFNFKLNHLPFIPQALLRASLYGLSFSTTWLLSTLILLHPLLSFTFTCLLSLIWLRFCPDPERLFESFVVTYHTKTTNQNNITDNDNDNNNNQIDAEFQTPSARRITSLQREEKVKKITVNNNNTRNTRRNKQIQNSVDIDDDHDNDNDEKEQYIGDDDHYEKLINKSSLADHHHAKNKITKSQSIYLGFGWCTMRHLVVALLCASVVYISSLSYRELWNELSDAPVFNEMSPVDYKEYLTNRLSSKYIGSSIVNFANKIKNTFLLKRNTNLSSMIKEQAKIQAKDFITHTREKASFTINLIRTMYNKLTSLTYHTLAVLFLPQSILNRNTINNRNLIQHQISHQDYPGYLIHFAYMMLCVYLSCKICFHLRNCNYISTTFLSPFTIRRNQLYQSSQPEQQQQHQRHPQPFATEIDKLAYDDGVITSLLQGLFMITLSMIIYFTGGVIVPLSFYCIDQFIQFYRNIKIYRLRDNYAQIKPTPIPTELVT